jgi:predicted DNA-binding ribbon-helix-helix protein
MKEKSIRIRLSQRRYDKLKFYAESKEKTVTQLAEDWIDRLPNPKNDDSALRAATLTYVSLPNQPDG